MLRKIITIFLSIVALIAFGIGIYILYNEPVQESSLVVVDESICGDGICDEFEKANNDLCSKDCNTPITDVSEMSLTYTSNYSPFGFLMGVPENNFEKHLSEAQSLSVGWVRLTGPTGIVWDRAEMQKGKYNWTFTDNSVTKSKEAGMNVLMTVLAVNKNYGVQYGTVPTGDGLAAYENFLKSAVERYDGDGVDDAPGSPKIEAWQIGNEVDGTHSWKDGPEKYAELLKVSYKIIKAADPDAKVVIAGMIGMKTGDFFGEVLSSLNGSYFDVFDFHWHCGGGGDYKKCDSLGNMALYENFDEYLGYVKNLFSIYGYNDAEIWITEMSYSDRISVGSVSTQRSQAMNLVKSHIYSLANDVRVVFWMHTYDEPWENNKDHYFSNTALINLDGNKKLSYYSYRLMMEKLAGSDWNNIVKVQDSEDIHVYRFDKRGESVWVAWNDSASAKTLTIEMENASSVEVTEAIPSIESGFDVTTYDSAFLEKTVLVSDGKVIYELRQFPIFIEVSN